MQHIQRTAVYQYWKGTGDQQGQDPEEHNGWCKKVWDVTGIDGTVDDFTIKAERGTDGIYPPAYCVGPPEGVKVEWRYRLSSTGGCAPGANADLPEKLAAADCFEVTSTIAAHPTMTAHLCTRQITNWAAKGGKAGTPTCPSPDANGYDITYPPDLD